MSLTQVLGSEYQTSQGDGKREEVHFQFIEKDETIDVAVQREVFEEAGVKDEMEGKRVEGKPFDS